MKYLSICSGIEAASVAFGPLGWKPLAFSEIEAFPRAVLQHHYPDTPLHGDFTKLKDEPWIVDADMLCGGTPCQAFSVAGLRQSLADDRGNLTLQFVLLADAIDNLRRAAGREPAWILWENVPGVLSTKDNAFGAFLGGLCGRHEPIAEPADGWTRAGVVDGPARVAAWRVMDAQHFGLAQRRKRVFVLARGGTGRWAVADALLPIIESGGWHPAPSRGTGEGVAYRTVRSLAIRGREGAPQAELGDEIANAILTPSGGRGGIGVGAVLDIAHILRGEGHDASEDGTGRGVPLVPYRVHGEHSTAMRGNGVARVADPAEVARCLDTCGGYSTNQGGNVVLTTHEVVGSLCAESGPNTHGSRGVSGTQTMLQGYIQPTLNMQVRRLTPVECERLQGFPDGYTNIPWRGKPESPDGPRYKALGNSWAVPCARWIGERIEDQLNRAS